MTLRIVIAVIVKLDDAKNAVRAKVERLTSGSPDRALKAWACDPKTWCNKPGCARCFGGLR